MLIPAASNADMLDVLGVIQCDKRCATRTVATVSPRTRRMLHRNRMQQGPTPFHTPNRVWLKVFAIAAIMPRARLRGQVPKPHLARLADFPLVVEVQEPRHAVRVWCAQVDTDRACGQGVMSTVPEHSSTREGGVNTLRYTCQ